jgi:serine/threonine-protein kinase
VLFEMATGRRPFEGASSARLTASILQQDAPSAVVMQPLLPKAFDRLVQRCLAKEPDERWQSARDLAFALRSITGDEVPAGAAASGAAKPRAGRAGWGAAIAATLLAVAGVAWGLTRGRPAEAPRLTRFTIQLPPGERLPTAMWPTLALSPDGSMLAYVAARNNVSRLYLRRFDRLAAEVLPGTDGAAAPFFSPDAQWIGFFAERKLKKISVGGRGVTTLTDAPDAWGGTWRADDTIVFNAGGFGGLSQVAASGGTARSLTTTNRAARSYEHQWPHALPADNAIIHSVWTGGTFDNARIEALPTAGGNPRLLVEGGFAPQYLPTGHILYARRRGLFVIPFDASRLEVTGAAVRVLEGVSTAATGAVQAAVAGAGTMAYVPGGRDRSVVRVDRSGARTVVLETHATYAEDPMLSPDGARLALTLESDSGVDVWVADLSRQTQTRLTSGLVLAGFTRWSPDGARVVYSASVAGETSKLFWQPADGSGPAERLSTGERIQSPNAFSADGKRLLFTEFHPRTGGDLWVLPLDGDRTPRPLLQTAAAEDWGVYSPDGRHIAYVSDESGRDEVYIVGAEGQGAKWRVSTDGGREPRWVGDEIFYRSRDRVMIAAVRTRPAVVVDPPRVRYDGWMEPCTLPGCRSFDVTRDGRDLLVLSGDPGPPTEIHVVLGWFRELEAAMAGAVQTGRR